jgi:hypothetical protein
MLADAVRQASIAEEFAISVQTVNHYAKANRERIQQIAQERGDLALTTGLAIRGNRKAKLEKLAASLEKKLGEDFEFANGASLPMVKEWRETLNQIRTELKDLEDPKAQRVELSGPNGGPIESRDVTDWADISAKATALLNGFQP